MGEFLPFSFWHTSPFENVIECLFEQRCDVFEYLPVSELNWAIEVSNAD